MCIGPDDRSAIANVFRNVVLVVDVLCACLLSASLNFPSVVGYMLCLCGRSACYQKQKNILYDGVVWRLMATRTKNIDFMYIEECECKLINENVVKKKRKPVPVSFVYYRRSDQKCSPPSTSIRFLVLQK